MTDTITINDPELAAMFESAAPTVGDIPGFVCLGHTKDGRTRDDFEDEDEFEDYLLRVSIEHASIAQVSAHLIHEGMKARAAYLHILSLGMIRDKMLERAGGNPEANFMEMVKAHVEEHGDDTETRGARP